MPPPGGGAGRVVLFLPDQFKLAGRNQFKPASFSWQKLAKTGRNSKWAYFTRNVFFNPSN